MRLICPLSGITYNSSHFRLSKITCIHPIFMLDINELDIIVSQWKARLLNTDETKLLCIALLYNTELVTIKEPLIRLSIDTCESVMYPLYELLCFIKSNSRNLDYWNKTLEYEGFSYKVFMTAILSNSNINNIQSLITEWENNKCDYIANYKATKARQLRASQSETAQQALRKIHTKPAIAGKRLANWAREATNFPKVGIARNNRKVALSDYWCFIIESCATRYVNNDLYGKVYKDDIQLLIDYLIDTSNVFINKNPLDMGNPLSYTLLKLLKDSIKDLDCISISDYQLIKDIELDIPDLPSDIVNKDTPLLTKPLEKDYPTKVKYNIALAEYSSQQNRLRGII